MATPHNSANKGDFAKTVLMPGDPVRSKFIAENFLDDAVLINDVRGIQGYTGTYKGVRVSVMASGIGMPSMALYSYELFHFFDVENIIRVGSAGSIHKDIDLNDIVIGMGACTTSAFARQYDLGGDYSAICSYPLLKTCMDTVEELGIGKKCHVGNVISSDAFYGEDENFVAKWSGMGVLAIEMEAAALYMNAAQAGKNALTVCTISDHLFTGKEITREDREKGFTDMIRLALETAIKL